MGVDKSVAPGKPSGLNLLLCEADEHAPVVEKGLGTKSAKGQEPYRKQVLPKTLWNEGGDPNSLPEQRWGVIVPEGDDGDRLLDLMAPLIQQRQEQQDAPVKIYRAPAKVDAAEAMVWRKKHFDSGSDTNEELPRYQLILGNLDQVALAIQQVQAIDGFVGRLAFDNLDHYRSYAEKVLRYEHGEPRKGPSRATFFTVHDGTDATSAGYQSLISPGVSLAQRKVMENKLAAREIVDLGDKVIPSRDELLERVAQSDPSILFTLSHGAGAPRAGWKTASDQRLRQGAMSFGSDGLLLGSDVAERPFLPGGIWFMLACYGAGTPDVSAYRHWLENLASLKEFAGPATAVLKGLPRAGERPFIAALPQAVLQNPEGPLAFMGHIDLAWTYSFTELDSGSAEDRPGKFIQIISELLRGNRTGIGFRSLMLALGKTNSELTTIYDRQAMSPGADPKLEARRGHLWMLRQDLAAYMVLGDPAVRLPVNPNAKAGVNLSATAAPVPSSTPSVTTSPSPNQSETVNMARMMMPGMNIQLPDPIDVDRIERAIAQLILTPEDAEQLARDAKISVTELRQRAEKYRQAGRAVLK